MHSKLMEACCGTGTVATQMAAAPELGLAQRSWDRVGVTSRKSFPAARERFMQLSQTAHSCCINRLAGRPASGHGSRHAKSVRGGAIFVKSFPLVAACFWRLRMTEGCFGTNILGQRRQRSGEYREMGRSDRDRFRMARLQKSHRAATSVIGPDRP